MTNKYTNSDKFVYAEASFS